MNVALQTSNVMGNPIGGRFSVTTVCCGLTINFILCEPLKEHWMGSPPQKKINLKP